MFEKYINRKQEQISSVLELSESRNNISEVLDNDDIDKSIKHYIYSEVEWWIYKIKEARSEIKYFDMEDSELRQEYNKLDSLLKRKAILSKDEFRKLIDGAIKARFNILLRPRISLGWFVYRDYEKISINEIKYRLKYFTDYSYIYDGFIKWANENKFDDTENIELEKFNSVIEEIDNEFVFNLNSDGLISLLEPLYKIFDYKNAEGNYLLPIEALIVFFDDKSIYQLVDKFDEQINEAGIEFLDQTSLLEIIQSLSGQNEEEEEVEGDDINVDSIDNEDLGVEESIEENEVEDFEEGGFDEVEIEDENEGIDEKNLESENEFAELAKDFGEEFAEGVVENDEVNIEDENIEEIDGNSEEDLDEFDSILSDELEVENDNEGDGFSLDLGEAFDDKNDDIIEGKESSDIEEGLEEIEVDTGDSDFNDELIDDESIDVGSDVLTQENVDGIIDDELVEVENELEIGEEFEDEMGVVGDLESEFGRELVELDDELNSELVEEFGLEKEVESELEDGLGAEIEDSEIENGEEVEEDFDAMADSILNDGKESEVEENLESDDGFKSENDEELNKSIADDSTINSSINEISEMLSKSVDNEDYKEIKDFISDENSEESLEEPNEIQSEIIEVLKELKK